MIGALVQPGWISILIRHLPPLLLGALNGWSHRLAQRRAAARRERWLRRQGTPAPVATTDRG